MFCALWLSCCFYYYYYYYYYYGDVRVSPAQRNNFGKPGTLLVSSDDWQDQTERYQHWLDWQSDFHKRCSPSPRHEGMYGDWKHCSTSSQKEISSVSELYYSDHLQYIAPAVKKKEKLSALSHTVCWYRVVWFTQWTGIVTITTLADCCCNGQAVCLLCERERERERKRATADFNVFSTNPGLRLSLCLCHVCFH